MVEIWTSQGRLRGKVDDAVSVFYNIPYACSQAGDQRFRLPQPFDGWTGVRDATKQGKVCVQPNLPISVFPTPKAPLGDDGVPTNMSEDALVVNVFAPSAKPSPADRKAVMFWIHGGAFVHGEGYSALYDGRWLAASQDVVVVSCNYRLGPFGFMYKEGAGIPANLGIEDQILALKWVQKNIEAFGGDPTSVTIFGESAGAMSAATILAAPKAKGLFRRAILQSGAGSSITAADAGSVADALGKLFGLRPEQVTADALRAIPAKDIREQMEKLKMGSELTFAPVETPDFPHPLRAVQAGAGRDVDVLSGTTKDEYNLFMAAAGRKLGKAQGEAYLRRRIAAGVFGHGHLAGGVNAAAQRIADATASAAESPKDVFSQVCTDWLFTIPHERFLAAHGGKNYAYRFDWASPMAKLKSCHALELPFVWGTHRHRAISLFSGKGVEADKLSQAMMASWGNFAKTGDPSSTATGYWPPFDTFSRPCVVFGDKRKATVKLCRNLRAEELAAWEGVQTAKL
ncbi:Para-nitrobenzyl esterase [Diplonema papillatum]|nr:Para-nitrobenzyl esterase [Diplonema papillatum]